MQEDSNTFIRPESYLGHMSNGEEAGSDQESLTEQRVREFLQRMEEKEDLSGDAETLIQDLRNSDASLGDSEAADLEDLVEEMLP